MSSISSSVISVLHSLGGVVVGGVKKRDSSPTLFKTFHHGQRQALANEDFVSVNVSDLAAKGHGNSCNSNKHPPIHIKVCGFCSVRFICADGNNFVQ